MFRIVFSVILLVSTLVFVPAQAIAKSLQNHLTTQKMQQFCLLAGDLAVTTVQARNMGVPSFQVLQHIKTVLATHKDTHPLLLPMDEAIIVFVYAHPHVQALSARADVQAWCHTTLRGR